jgi:starch synthase
MKMGGTEAARYRPRVLFAASEAYPLVKTGGLGDVAGALPIALARLGHDIRLVLPGYPCALELTEDKRSVSQLPDGQLISGRIPGSGLPVYLLDRPDLFRRSGGLYQDSNKQDWPDNHIRFSIFCNAVTHIALHGDGAGWRPDLVHANDWHTGMVPARLALESAIRPATVFTIHNMAFQGNFPLSVVEHLELPASLLASDGAEFFGQLSFLKAGIRYSDRLTTVSPTYAHEILTREHGAGLDGVLRSRAGALVGILNGVDNTIWSPSADRNLSAQYCVDSMAGKDDCKATLQNMMRLEHSADIPLLGFVSRLTDQKMADVLLQALPALMAHEIQLVVHGEGDTYLEEAFLAASRKYSSRLAVRIGYREALAHQVIAAADIALTPARFEPCGLTAMYAMLYGTPPVARAVGGLVDTVVDAVSESAIGATGYMFNEPTVRDLTTCVREACQEFSNKTVWRQVRRNAMQRDFSWDRAARRYAAVYRDLLPADPWLDAEHGSSDTDTA